MDAMVTARMAAAKKELGNRLLAEMGTNASQAINELYDYVISFKRLPFSPAVGAATNGRADRLKEAIALVDGIPKVELDKRFVECDMKEIRRERLERRGLMDVGA